ncbi:MAG TPA: isoprenylcysteine carboxylmethyltransferase family protein [Candidatus Paceibacterota bacterium]|nr:isoprenylcysteine carboxylmethyltransferase family protein [Candidatus Paceibacterota bacterium]
MKKNSAKKPASVTNFFQSLVSLVVSLGVFAVCEKYFPGTPERNVLIACGVLAGMLILFNLFARKIHRSSDTGLDFSHFTPSLSRVLRKLLALLFTLGTVAFAYWLFPEYHGSFYDPYWNFLWIAGVVMLILVFPYFWIVDGAQVDPEDSYLHLGKVLTLQNRPNWDILKTHFGGWAIKGFFLPLMVVYMNGNALNALSAFTQMSLPSGNWLLPVYDFAFNGIFFIDVLFTVVGYTLTLRLFGSHIRSVQPSTLGWVVTLVCYQPFWSFFSSTYFSYSDGFEWGTWLRPYPWMLAFWGGAIILLMLVYVASTVSFGQRFSNLTHRGIITGGPYRFSKHPAYISKNISWWLISIPFIPHLGLVHALQASLLLGGVNVIYFLRAKTEERHLMSDPVYQEYAAWIDKHGFFAVLKRRMRKFFPPNPHSKTATVVQS